MTDVLVIGGGLAGAAAACHLARAGRDVVLAEAEAHPQDKVCGEFISVEAAHYLHRLGIDLPALGAVPIDRVRLASAGRVAEARLPFPAWSLSRRVLDNAVLQRAAACGAAVRRGCKVGYLNHDGALWRAETTEGAIQARNCFLATGKHDLRGWRRPAGRWRDPRHADLVAFKLHLRLAPAQHQALTRTVLLFLLPEGYGGIEPIEAGRANLCVLLRRAQLQALSGQWRRVLDSIIHASPAMETCLTGAEPLWPRPLAIAAIPYGHVQRAGSGGLWRLGDQAAVIPSFAGDGMAIALHSAWRAAAQYQAGASPDHYQRQLARDVGWQVRRATILSRLLVSPAGPALARLAAAAPSLLRQVARATRIPHAALQDAR